MTSESDIRNIFSDRIKTAAAEPALFYEGTSRDWCWMAALSIAVETALAEEGLAGTPAALIARNHPLAVGAVVAQVAAGRATAMIYGSLPEAALAAELRAVRLPVLIVERTLWSDMLLRTAWQTGTAALILDELDGVPAVELRASPVPGDFRAVDPTTGFEILSSGTTGPPKRIPLRWSTVTAAVIDAAGAYAGSAVGTPQIMLHPLGNVSGIAYLLPAIARGQPVVLMDKFAVGPWLAAVAHHRPARVALPPAAVRMMMEDASIPRDALDGIAVVGVGGGALDPDLRDAFEQRFSIPILTAFGATEFGGVIANWSLEDHRRWGREKRGSAGRVRAGVALRIVSAQGQPLPMGEIGLLEAQVDRIGPQWARTTDLARLDEDGFLFVEGRADGAINRGGFKILPEKIARVAEAYPGVAEAAVVARPDARLGAVPVAAVEPVAGMTIDPDALTQWLRDRLLPYEIPLVIRVVPALPRTASMKVRLDGVAALFAPDDDG